MSEFYFRRKAFYRVVYHENNCGNACRMNGFDSVPVKAYSAISELVAKPGPILDIGCGNGMLLKQIVESKPFYLEPYGFDFLPESIRYARKKIWENREDNFWVGNLRDAAFKNDFFNTIMFDPYHLDGRNRKSVTEEILKLVKDGGRLILYSYYDSLYYTGVGEIRNYYGLKRMRFELKWYLTVPKIISVNYIQK